MGKVRVELRGGGWGLGRVERATLWVCGRFKLG